MDAAPIQHIELIDGNAMIAGSNLKARLVAAMVIKGGASIEETAAHYNLTPAQIHAALAYYHDNREAIEQAFAEAESYVRQYGVNAEEHLTELRNRQQNDDTD